MADRIKWTGRELQNAIQADLAASEVLILSEDQRLLLFFFSAWVKSCLDEESTYSPGLILDLSQHIDELTAREVIVQVEKDRYPDCPPKALLNEMLKDRQGPAELVTTIRLLLKYACALITSRSSS